MERSLLFRPRLGFGIFCLLLIAWFFGSANAMTFEIVQVGDEPAIISHGEIVSGDADRLRMVLIARAKHKGIFSPGTYKSRRKCSSSL